ncbi:glutaconyl-CoA decarboxylase subunit beta [Fulvitalea axinellae]|uniref:Glutaconyl-CoA decarboxylase subunit beta n=2 Tax=Fulvitalea axinellae TaxID=1182444 RepID=A0AAU9CLM6_9BACT|nr:glutaconyl-CoA decarboxylase subunit beta [Fulvitalea axinellae]
MTALGQLSGSPGTWIMIVVGLGLLYLGIVKEYEPLLLVPIAFGVILANSLGSGLGIVPSTPEIEHMTLLEIAKHHGILNFLYYALIKTGFLPPIIFMGVGALTDFGPMLRNLRLAFFGAAAQIGIFTVVLAAVAMGFTLKEAASLGIIGGADGPTAIYTTIMLAPHLLGPIAIAAYSYMALVPVIIPLVARLTMTKEEYLINMKQQDKKYPSAKPIKNLRVAKILFPLVTGGIVAILVPSAVPLVGMLLFGNLIKEVGANTGRLKDAATGAIMNSATIFLGLTVGATMTADTFLNMKTLGIIVGGFLAFAISIAGGIFAVKAYNLFAKKKINPLIGATGLSAVPMASRVANDIALKHDPRNHILQYAMASNISGVIGSAVAAGVLISFLS